MRESAIERPVNAFAKAHGITSLKLAGPGDRGKSDRMFTRHGKTAFMELKAPLKKPTALQLKFLSERRLDGFDADWFDNAPAAICWLRQIFDIES
jgi:hypothetical protein